MKKTLSLILAIAMAMTALTGIALAEAAETTETESELSGLLNLLGSLTEEKGTEGGEEVDLSSFLGQLGSLFKGEEEGAVAKTGEETGEGINLTSLMGMLGGAFGENGSAAADYPKAESVDQFFGTWKLSKITFLGEDVPLTEENNTTLIINEKGIFFDEVDENETELVLKDGHLSFGEKDAVIIHLSETGVCFCLAGILDMDFVAAE